MNLCDYNTLRALLSRHGFHFSKTMGQNFLIDPRIPEAIAEASGAGPGWGVLEIGPGAGCLTRELSARAERVAAIELDRKLLPVLAETLADCPNVEIVPGDVLKLDLAALALERFFGLRCMVCANLPYNITTPVLTRLVETECFQAVTVLLQKEVAERLAAPQGSSDGGAFSLWLQYFCETKTLFDVPSEKFLPRPKVDSAVLQCVRRERPAVEVDDEAWFFRVVRGAFLLRRKTLANSLAAALTECPKDAVQDCISACGLPGNVRGERLTLQDFAALSSLLRERIV